MYHSITFGDKNTWTDWHLVPTSRPVIGPPKPKTQYVDIPGADGSIDLTESLAGRPVYSDREGSLEFYVLNDYDLDNYNYNWIEVYTGVMQYLHGRSMKMILEDDPEYYYEGRFTVNTWKSDANHSTITIDYKVGPYKYRTISAIGASDFEIGALGVSGSGDTFSIVELDSITNTARMKAPPKPYAAGDSIRADRKYSFDVALYGGTADSPTSKNMLWTSGMNGNSYTFEDSGFYRINIRKTDFVSDTVTADDLSAMAAAIHYYTGGIL